MGGTQSEKGLAIWVQPKAFIRRRVPPCSRARAASHTPHQPFRRGCDHPVGYRLPPSGRPRTWITRSSSRPNALRDSLPSSPVEPILEPVFHRDSYGHRPGQPAIDAVRAARERCWPWVLDLDVQAYFRQNRLGDHSHGAPLTYGLSLGVALKRIAGRKRSGN
jgi:hypothetical protein